MNKNIGLVIAFLSIFSPVGIQLYAQEELGGNNFIYQKTFRNSSGSNYSESVSYYNGLGYLAQEIEFDVYLGDARVSFYKMDPMRRLNAKTYLPFIFDVDTGVYHQNADQLQAAYYASRTSRPFVQTEYEPGKDGRPVYIQKAGDAFQADGKRMSFAYGYNTLADGIHDLQYHYRSGSQWGTNPPYVDNTGIMPTNALHKTRTVTEDCDTSYVFTDAFDKTICERRINGGQAFDTYYVYDLTDRLVCVIQPEGIARLGSSFSFEDSFAAKYCFTYEYDAHGRQIRRHVPGGGTERFAYDNRDRLVFYDDALMRANDIAKYYIYDAMDRIVEEGYGEDPVGSWDYLTLVIGEGEFPYENGFGGDLHPTHRVWYVPNHCSWDWLREEEALGLYDTDVDWGRCKTLISYEQVWDTPEYSPFGVSFRDSTFTERQYYYDSLGRILQRAEKDRWTGMYSWNSYMYNLQGQVTAELERHAESLNSNGDWIMLEHTYDNRGRKTGTTVSSDGFTRSAAYGYDEMDRLSSTQTGAVSETLTYNLQGWLTARNTQFGNQSILQSWNYYDLPATNRRYDGKIRSQVLQFSLTDNVQQQYAYDHLGRITSYQDSRNGVEDYQYDRNGNITGITTENIFRDALTSRTYDGNRLTYQSVFGMDHDTDGEIEFEEEYYWNANGSLSGTDLPENFSYNVLGLLSEYDDGHNGLRYRYLSDGTKVSSMDFAGKGLEYRGSFVYRRNGNGSRMLESIATPTGRLLAQESTPGVRTWSDRYCVQNQVGSTVAVAELGTSAGNTPIAILLEKTSYSPYGEEMYTFGTTRDSLNRYRFNGKENQDLIGHANPGLSDYGARMFAHRMHAWTTPDPLADKYYSISPYAYCAGNPVNVFDPDGRKLYYAKGSSDVFKIKFAEAVKIMNEKGTSYNLAKLDQSDQVYYIQEASPKGNRFDPKTQTIEWDPSKVSYDDQTGLLRSPLTSLAHEAGHANKYDEAVKNDSLDSFKASIITVDKQYGNKEEKRNITTTEQYAARRHGEISGPQVTRYDHTGERYPGKFPDFSKMTMQQILNYVIETNRIQGSIVVNKK